MQYCNFSPSSFLFFCMLSSTCLMFHSIHRRAFFSYCKKMRDSFHPFFSFSSMCLAVRESQCKCHSKKYLDGLNSWKFFSLYVDVEISFWCIFIVETLDCCNIDGLFTWPSSGVTPEDDWGFAKFLLNDAQFYFWFDWFDCQVYQVELNDSHLTKYWILKLRILPLKLSQCTLEHLSPKIKIMRCKYSQKS